MDYAKSKEAKLKKRKALLDEVKKRYDKNDFDHIRMLDVAKGCHVSKGTVFNYFESKETLFLSLLMREYGQWFDGLYQRILSAESLDKGEFINLVLDYVEDALRVNEKLFHLVGLGHSRLEHNVSLRIAEQYRRFINDQVTKIGYLVTSKVSGVTQIQSIKMMMTLHTLFIGHGQMARLPQVMTKELPLDELEMYEVDFRVTLIETLKVYLKGLFMANR